MPRFYIQIFMYVLYIVRWCRDRAGMLSVYVMVGVAMSSENLASLDQMTGDTVVGGRRCRSEDV